MSDDLEEDEPQESTPKQLREAAKRGRDAEARADAAERELAFARAGVDLNDAKAGYFIRGYDGELDPSKIREAAERDGFLNQPAPVQTGATTEEQAAIQRVSQATEGAGTPAPSDYNVDLAELRQTAMREHWDPDRFSMEVAKTVQKLGGDVALDGYEFVPPQY